MDDGVDERLFLCWEVHKHISVRLLSPGAMVCDHPFTGAKSIG